MGNIQQHGYGQQQQHPAAPPSSNYNLPHCRSHNDMQHAIGYNGCTAPSSSSVSSNGKSDYLPRQHIYSSLPAYGQVMMWSKSFIRHVVTDQ